MRKFVCSVGFALALVVLVTTLIVGQAAADKPTQVGSNGVEVAWEKGNCTTIQSGKLTSSTGVTLTTGFDQWGYNYQAHMFNGKYCHADHDAPWCQAYTEGDLIMKWNDAWLSNVDCDGDSLLDRHYGFDSYIGSGAWLTNHQSGSYVDDSGATCKWTYFVKIVAAPSDAYKDGDVWYASDGTEIGPVIWGDFAVIQEISNDGCAAEHGVLYQGEAPTGFGFYNP